MFTSLSSSAREKTTVLILDQRAIERAKEGMGSRIRRFKQGESNGRIQISTLMELDLVPVPGTLCEEGGNKTGEVRIRGKKRTSFRIPVSFLTPRDEINQKIEDFFF